jgi:hypothetical protein
VEDAKFESRVNEENKRNWISSLRQQSEGRHKIHIPDPRGPGPRVNYVP